MDIRQAYLLKPKLSIWAKVQYSVGHELEDLDHQIFVHGRFILGNFKERKEGFILNPNGIYFRKEGEEDYRTYVDEFMAGKYEEVRQFTMPESDIEKITQQAIAYQTAQSKICDLIPKVDKYFE